MVAARSSLLRAAARGGSGEGEGPSGTWVEVFVAERRRAGRETGGGANRSCPFIEPPLIIIRRGGKGLSGTRFVRPRPITG